MEDHGRTGHKSSYEKSNTNFFVLQLLYEEIIKIK